MILFTDALIRDVRAFHYSVEEIVVLKINDDDDDMIC